MYKRKQFYELENRMKENRSFIQVIFGTGGLPIEDSLSLDIEKLFME